VIPIDDDRAGSDREFVLACKSGDLRAFSELYTRHGSTVMRYAWSRLGDRPQAEDVLQETFATAWTKIRTATVIDRSLLPWLLAIASNHLRNQYRRNEKHRTVPITNVPDRAHDKVGDLEAITEALDNLSPLDRAICELCLVDGLTYKEAASSVRSTPAAVRNRLQRARARLRDSLAEK